MSEAEWQATVSRWRAGTGADRIAELEAELAEWKDTARQWQLNAEINAETVAECREELAAAGAREQVYGSFAAKAVDIMKREGIVIDDLNDPMQKLAFTFYNLLVEIASRVEQAQVASDKSDLWQEEDDGERWVDKVREAHQAALEQRTQEVIGVFDDLAPGVLDHYESCYDPENTLRHNVEHAARAFHDWMFDDIDSRLDDEYGKVMQYLEAMGHDVGPLRERIDAALEQVRAEEQERWRPLVQRLLAIFQGDWPSIKAQFVEGRWTWLPVDDEARDAIVAARKAIRAEGTE